MPQKIPKAWHHLSPEKIFRTLETSAQGLTEKQSASRLLEFGPNELQGKKNKSALLLFLEQFHQPLIYILIAAGIVTALLGETVDASVIFAVVLVNAVVGYIQEAKAANALAALAESMAEGATVLRQGAEHNVSARDLVPGDLVIVRAGDKIPADLRLIMSKNLRTDEAPLTGESLPVEKQTEILPEDTLLAERSNMAYASTLVAAGEGRGIVISTGSITELGRISTMVSQADELETPLTRQVARFSMILLWVILGLSVITFAAGLWRGESVTDMFMAAVALAVGAIPEGLPAALTVILATGVSRMAKRGAIIRRLPAVETLGSASIICSDKTGTLTRNQMTVRIIYAGGQEYTATGTGYSRTGAIENFTTGNQALLSSLEAGKLCNDSRLEGEGEETTVVGDPTEGALLVSAAKAPAEIPFKERLDVLPFESEHQYMATLHAGDSRRVYIKGSAEAILQRCRAALTPQGGEEALDHDLLEEKLTAFARQGMRVLALAQKDSPDLETLTHESIQDGLVFLGFQAMIDPPREEAQTAVNILQKAGVTVKMITGDHGVTAAAIGHQLGLDVHVCPEKPLCQVLTGKDLTEISDDALPRAALDTDVFARVAPEQKLRLVTALQKQGEIVAMTGDGVNDAPALKQANIGVAMGLGGTEAAKEASDIVLTDDNFATIEAAVEEGRGVYDNLLKFIVWTLPTNLGEGLVILVAVLLGVTLPIIPVQILWINMTTAGTLGLMLAFEAKEADVMNRPPRRADAPLLSAPLLFRIFLVGMFLLCASFGLYEYALYQGARIEEARTVAVNAFVFIEGFYLFNCRSLTKSPFALGFFSNIWVLAGCALTVILQLIFTYAPFMNTFFHSTPLRAPAWIGISAVSLLAFVLIEGEKKFLAQRFAPKTS